MALFTGSGEIILNGDCKVYDMKMEIPTRVQGSESILEANLFLQPVTVGTDAGRVIVAGNRWNTGAGGALILEGGNHRSVIVDNDMESVGGLAAIDVTDSEEVSIQSNTIRSSTSGVSIDGGVAVVKDNLIIEPGYQTDDTYSGVVLVSGDLHHVAGNRIFPAAGVNATRAGVSILAGDCNRVVGNDFGDDPAAFGTMPIEDLGTNTMLSFPNNPAAGDNFVDCTIYAPAPGSGGGGSPGSIVCEDCDLGDLGNVDTTGAQPGDALVYDGTDWGPMPIGSGGGGGGGGSPLDWQSYTPTLTNVTISDGTVSGRYMQSGDVVAVQIRFVLGSSSSITGTIGFGLPASLPAVADSGIGAAWGLNKDVAFYTGTSLNRGNTTLCQVYSHNTGNGWNASTPFSWGSTDEMQVGFIYETSA